MMIFPPLAGVSGSSPDWRKKGPRIVISHKNE
jgi:hypothetical protein